MSQIYKNILAVSLLSVFCSLICLKSQAAIPMQSGMAQVSNDLSGVRVRPNPWRSDKHSSQHFVTFDPLVVNTTIKIFTVSGRWVKTLPASNTAATWDLTNDSGKDVASGIYLYVMTTDSGQEKTGK